MKKNVWLVAPLFLILLLSAFTNERKVKIFMIGDSTMANKDIDGGNLERGWGMMLNNFFDGNVVVDNHAKNGRSSKSFISEGLWKTVRDQIKPGDYVFIQFGHNDEKQDTVRHTEPGTTFDANLRMFVNETKARGGIPVLFNSVVRRTFAVSNYLVSPRKVAEETGTVFIDANKITHRLEQDLGPVGSRKLHMCYEPGEVPSLPEGRQDNTHYNVYGAYTVAGLLADAVADKVPELRRLIRHCDVSVAKDGRGLYFDVQEAVDSLPDGCKATVLVGEGEWRKPSIPARKDVKFVMRDGAKWID